MLYLISNVDTCVYFHWNYLSTAPGRLKENPNIYEFMTFSRYLPIINISNIYWGYWSVSGRVIVKRICTLFPWIRVSYLPPTTFAFHKIFFICRSTIALFISRKFSVWVCVPFSVYLRIWQTNMSKKILSWVKPYPELALEGDGVFCKPCGKMVSLYNF